MFILNVFLELFKLLDPILSHGCTPGVICFSDFCSFHNYLSNFYIKDVPYEPQDIEICL